MTTSAGARPEKQPSGLPVWLSAMLPLVALALLLSVFALGDPLALLRADLPPIEELTFERIRVVEDGFDAMVVNGGPDPVQVSQILVDDAYWAFTMEPDQTVAPLERARIFIPYPWVATEAHAIKIITETGVTFEGEVELAVRSPVPGLRQFIAYGLVGVYVGIIPVGLGMLWYPAMRRMGRRWLGAILALTEGLLVFLLIDTLLEALEVAGGLPGVFQGVALVIFAALLTWFALMAIGAGRGRRRGIALATLIALSIGLHNLGEGLAIGAAFALGEAALGSFLVIGFTLHNVTEGVGIAAPLLPDLDQEKAEPPSVLTFAGLALLAGFPAVLGAWIGGFAFSPLLTVLFLGVGVGAIWQVIVDVGRLLGDYAEAEGEPLFSWLNIGAFVLGLAIMYLTAFLVSA